MKPEQVVLEDGREVTLIHFFKDGRIACMPNMAFKDMSSNRERIAPHMRSDSVGGVTCPMCKKTGDWKAASK